VKPHLATIVVSSRTPGSKLSPAYPGIFEFGRYLPHNLGELTLSWYWAEAPQKFALLWRSIGERLLEAGLWHASPVPSSSLPTQNSLESDRKKKGPTDHTRLRRPIRSKGSNLEVIRRNLLVLVALQIGVYFKVRPSGYLFNHASIPWPQPYASPGISTDLSNTHDCKLPTYLRWSVHLIFRVAARLRSQDLLVVTRFHSRSLRRIVQRLQLTSKRFHTCRSGPANGAGSVGRSLELCECRENYRLGNRSPFPRPVLRGPFFDQVERS